VKLLIDPKRTIKARVVRVFEDDGSAPNGLDAEPGDCQRTAHDQLMFACPGCGQWGGVRATHPKEPSSWDVVSGSLDDAATLTLVPSIHCIGCCGWHGHLKNGIFESC
jgi:hypothetical protein